MRILLIVLLLSCASNVYAGDFIFHTDGVITGKRSSCGSSCSQRPDALRVTPEVFESVTKFHKVVDGSVVEMSQAEKNTILQAEADAKEQDELDRINNLDDEISNPDMSISLTKVDNAIDSIGSLADAKVFLKKLCRYIVANQ